VPPRAALARVIQGRKSKTVGATKPVTDATFEADVLKSDKPVIVDYWAEWCGPCRQVGPILEEIASEHDEIQVVKLNVDDNPKVSQQYGIMNIPTMSVFKGGEVVKEIVGAKPKSALLRDLAEFLSE
jgi:thioredoxin 1